MPKRSPDQTVTAISLPKGLLEQVDARAASLQMGRSAYLIQLIRTDLVRKGKLEVLPYPEHRDRDQLAADAPLQPGTPLPNPKPAPYKPKRKKPKS